MTGKSGMWMGVLALLALILVALAAVDTGGVFAQDDPTPESRPNEPFMPDLIAEFEVGPEITALKSIADETLVVSTEFQLLSVTQDGVVESLFDADALMSITALEANTSVTILEPLIMAETGASAVPFMVEVQATGNWSYEAPGIVSADGSITVLSVTEDGTWSIVHTGIEGNAIVMPLTDLGEAMPVVEASAEDLELALVPNIVNNGGPAVFEMVQADSTAKIVGWFAPDGTLHLVAIEDNDMVWAMVDAEMGSEVVKYTLESMVAAGEANWVAYPDGGGMVLIVPVEAEQAHVYAFDTAGDLIAHDLLPVEITTDVEIASVVVSDGSATLLVPDSMIDGTMQLVEVDPGSATANAVPLALDEAYHIAEGPEGELLGVFEVDGAELVLLVEDEQGGIHLAIADVTTGSTYVVEDEMTGFDAHQAPIWATGGEFVFVAPEGGHTVYVFDDEWTQSSYEFENVEGGISGMVVGPDSELYIADSIGSLYKFSLFIP